MLPIALLTLNGQVRGRRLILVGLLLATPALLALAYRGSERHPDGALFSVQMIDNLVLPLLIPLTALLLASTALGGEVEDRTLLYLTLRPVPRLSIAIGKLLAVSLITVALTEVSVLLMYLIAAAGSGESRVLVAGLVAGLVGPVAYCSLFLPLGLLAPRRGLIVGLIYVLVWEATAAGISAVFATLSVRRYVLGTIDATLDSARLINMDRATVGGLASILVLVAVVAAAIGFTTWWIRRMEIP
jgi:ABC-2 type transport system permease protein